MRWDALFADLEAHADALAHAERAAEVETRTRGEIGTLAVQDRLRAAVGTPLRMRFAGGVRATGVLIRVGPDWVLLDEGGGREIVAVTAQLLTVRGLGRISAVPSSAGVLESRLGLRHAVRGIARDRSPVRIHLATGGGGATGVTGTDGEAVTIDATIDRVGADFIEVATHAAGEVRRRDEVRDVELVPLVALVALRRSV